MITSLLVLYGHFCLVLSVSVQIGVWFLWCPCLFLSSLLSFIPLMLRVHMAGAVWTLVSGLCLSIFMLGLLCCPCLVLSSVLYFLPFMLCVVEFFDGLEILFGWSFFKVNPRWGNLKIIDIWSLKTIHILLYNLSRNTNFTRTRL